MKEEIYEIVFENTMKAADDYLDGRTLKGKELLAIVNAVGKAYATYICIVADIMNLDMDKFLETRINSVISFVQDLWSTQKIKESQPIID